MASRRRQISSVLRTAKRNTVRAVLMDEVLALVDRLVRRRQLAAARRHAQRRAAAAIDLVREVEDARAGQIVSVDGAHHRRAGAVAEQHAGRAIGVVDDARHHVGADHQHVVVRAGGDELRRRRQRVGEAGAGGAEVEAPGALSRRSCPAAGTRCSGRSCRRWWCATMMTSMSGGRDAGLLQRLLARLPSPGPRWRRRARRCDARGCRCAGGSTRRWCRPSFRGRRWSARAAARRSRARRPSPCRTVRPAVNATGGCVRVSDAVTTVVCPFQGR